MDESVETEDPSPASPPETLEAGVAERHWPTKPRT
jgi:hypothetical protein